MVQFMIFMASYEQCMTQLRAKFPPIDCIFGADLCFFVRLGPILQLTVEKAEFVVTNFIKNQILFLQGFFTSFSAFSVSIVDIGFRAVQ